jgi:hypothetical protein
MNFAEVNLQKARRARAPRLRVRNLRAAEDLNMGI